MPEKVEPIWSAIRDELRRETPDLKFHIWLDPLEAGGLVDSTLYVRAPEHIRGCVAERYLPLLRKAAVAQLGERAVVQVVGPDLRPPTDPPPPPPTAQRLTTLHPQYTLEPVVVGKPNCLAHASSLAPAPLPGPAHQPLFLHGPP